MKALIVSHPFPACILRSGDPARDHSHRDLAETFERNTPPIQNRIADDYELTSQLDYLENIGAFK